MECTYMEQVYNIIYMEYVVNSEPLPMLHLALADGLCSGLTFTTSDLSEGSCAM